MRRALGSRSAGREAPSRRRRGATARSAELPRREVRAPSGLLARRASHSLGAGRRSPPGGRTAEAQRQQRGPPGTHAGRQPRRRRAPSDRRRLRASHDVEARPRGRRRHNRRMLRGHADPLRGRRRGHGPRDALAGAARGAGRRSTRSTSSSPGGRRTTWRKRFENVHGIWGLTLAYEGNSVKKLADAAAEPQGRRHGLAAERARSTSSWWRTSSRTWWSATSSRFSYLFAKNHLLPVISVDNMQVINRCKHDPALLRGPRGRASRLTRAIVKASCPAPSTTSSRRSSTRRAAQGAHHAGPVHPAAGDPRGEARAGRAPARLPDGHHATRALPEILKADAAAVPRLRPAARPQGGRAWTATSPTGPSARRASSTICAPRAAVIAGGGFTLMSEAVYLHKPMLSRAGGGPVRAGAQRALPGEAGLRACTRRS